MFLPLRNVSIRKFPSISAVLVMLVLCILTPARSDAAIPQTYKPQSGEMWIKIDKENLKLTLRRGEGEIIKSYPVAVGRGKGVKKSRTDLITPAGVFKIWRVIQDATHLVYDPKWFGEPGGPQKGAYGAKLISFYNPWEIALHGTNAPSSIGRRVTHGCIRMRNSDIIELSKSVTPGMRLWIVERDAPLVEKDFI
ncbi:MAG: L,D-transpeptidase [Synergistaceae bacterium]|jgi:lipoprotein-anchoring transpeptidase ErfK/SrfK|nr:L,D-transpeptidase [Synergistaceae bacterium]